ncbi:MAG: hypothetical protein H5T91_02075 [Synergistetes bacterium]|nr:hypothetical protein [Synergistota bacterium]
MSLRLGGFIFLLTLGFYILVFFRSKALFKRALLRGAKNLIRNSVRIFSVFVVIGILQSFLSKELVGGFLMHFSGIKGILIGALIGALMMGPVISGYPICKYILENGGAVGLVSSFLFSWVMVGLVALPLEIKTLGGRFALVRNSFAIFSAIVLGLIMEALL